MSRSPSTPSSPAETYLAGWDAIMRLIRDGGSWSGRERNCVFLNAGDGSFADVSEVSGLDFADDARAVAVVDWDHDGDLDLWLRNRTAPRLRLMRNESRERRSVSIRLRGRNTNRDGIGARVEVVPRPGPSDPVLPGTGGQRLVRTVHAGSGFLSQSSKWLHFGLGSDGEVAEVKVRWPDGERQTVRGLEAGGHYVVEQGGGATRWRRPTAAGGLRPSPLVAPEPTSAGRVPLRERVPLPSLPYRDEDGARRTVEEPRRALLVTLWASWCLPCLEELSDITARAAELREAGADVLALTVEEADDDDRTGPEDAARRLDELGFPFPSGVATRELIEKIDLLQRALFIRPPEPSVPFTLLVDGDGRVAALYRGRPGVDSLLADIRALDGPADPEHWSPAPRGRRYSVPPPRDAFLRMLADRFLDAYPADATALLEAAAARLDERLRGPRSGRARVERAAAETHRRLGDALERQAESAAGDLRALLGSGGGKRDALLARALDHYGRAVEIRPGDAAARVSLGLALQARGRDAEAIPHYEAALAAGAGTAALHYDLGLAHYGEGTLHRAVHLFRETARLDPAAADPLIDLAWILATTTDDDLRDPAAAVAAAESARSLVDLPDAVLLDTLAAAYASSGRFEEAVAAAERAVAAAEDEGDPGLAAFAGERLALYRAGTAYRE